MIDRILASIWYHGTVRQETFALNTEKGLYLTSKPAYAETFCRHPVTIRPGDTWNENPIPADTAGQIVPFRLTSIRPLVVENKDIVEDIGYYPIMRKDLIKSGYDCVVTDDLEQAYIAFPGRSIVPLFGPD